MELPDYRRAAEQFVSELNAVFYRHYSGREERFEIEPVYARHAALFELSAVERLREAAMSGQAAGTEARRLELLLEFAVEGFVGEATKELEAALAEHEATARIELDGEQFGFRDAAVAQANEPDQDRRRGLEQARLAVIAHELAPLQRELAERQHAAAAELGYASYRAMCEQVMGIDLGALGAQTAHFAAATALAYPERLEPELQRVLGIGLSELRRADLPRFFRAEQDDAAFPADALVHSLRATLTDLGLDDAAGVVLDVEARQGKSPRAFCAPVRVPEEVYLVISPVGGRDDYSSLFHEAGHAEHYGHVRPGLEFEFRYLGDNSITESFAFLLQHLVDDPQWLHHRLGIDDAAPLAAYALAQRLLYLRRYAGKLAYELELHDRASLDGMAERYAQQLSAALQIPWPTETYLDDLDPGFYSARYLRAWALETHLRAHLRERFGEAWFTQREAGTLLRSLWQDGQRARPEELLGELTGAELDFGVLLADLDAEWLS